MTIHSPRRTRPNRTGPADGSISNMHDVLSDPARRRVLYALQTADGPVAPADLAALLPAADGTDADDAGRRLLHEHVVPMDEFGIVSYDRSSGTVSLPDDVTVSVDPDVR